MPITCEVCGNADLSTVGDDLHVCPDCIRDRRLAEEWAAEMPGARIPMPPGAGGEPS